MMRDLLRTELARRLPSMQFRTDASDGSIVLPAAHAQVGDVTILDDGDELTVYIGTITHGHFNDYTPDNSPDAQMRAIVDSVVWFLEDLVADRVLIWQSNGSGGWRIIEQDESLDVHSDAGTQFYLWSGPIG
jgi:hypothetical protein